MEGTGKALEGKRLGGSLAHTLLPPCPTVVLEWLRPLRPQDLCSSSTFFFNYKIVLRFAMYFIFGLLFIGL